MQTMQLALTQALHQCRMYTAVEDNITHLLTRADVNNICATIAQCEDNARGYAKLAKRTKSNPQGNPLHSYNMFQEFKRANIAYRALVVVVRAYLNGTNVVRAN